ncbi:MAG: hypothetical protein AB4206_22410 [Xenococcaceae cyanobacterium]
MFLQALARNELEDQYGKSPCCSPRSTVSEYTGSCLKREGCPTWIPSLRRSQVVLLHAGNRELDVTSPY